jgi:hypothetical protein
MIISFGCRNNKEDNFQKKKQKTRRKHKDVVHENLIGGNSIIWVFPLVIADPGPLGWYTSALTTGLQEVSSNCVVSSGAELGKNMQMLNK